MTREERDRIRKEAQTPEARDSRHTYRWSEHGIRVHANSGDWEGFYSLRHCEVPGDPPTRLLLIGISFGSPPAELAFHFVTLCDICKYITNDYEEDTRYNLYPSRNKEEIGEAEKKAQWLSS